jgi:uncharacterized protein (DUF983 family)
MRRACLSWHRQGLCPSCGKPSLVGYLDGVRTERACDSCGAHSTFAVRESRIRQLWRIIRKMRR